MSQLQYSEFKESFPSRNDKEIAKKIAEENDFEFIILYKEISSNKSYVALLKNENMLSDLYLNKNLNDFTTLYEFPYLKNIIFNKLNIKLDN